MADEFVGPYQIPQLLADENVARVSHSKSLAAAINNGLTKATGDAAADANTKYGELPARMATLETDKWYRGDLTSSAANVDTLNTNAHQGRWRVTSSAVQNLPVAAHGYVDVSRNPGDGRVMQVFTRSNTGPVMRYSRVFAGGAWSAWVNDGWNRGLVSNTATDLDTFTSVGVYAIQGVAQPNQPVPFVGTLEVLPASGSLTQRYTTWEPVPREFTRRYYLSAWQAWAETPNAGDMASLNSRVDSIGAGSVGLAAPTRATLTAAPVTVASKSNGQIMSSMSLDRSRGWNWGGNTLSETRDDGATWATVATVGTPFNGTNIESVMQLDNGELLVTANFITEGRRAALISEGYGKASPVTFTRVLTASAPYVKYTASWSQSAYRNIVLLAEYGPKTGALWGGETVAPNENARYVNLSLDYGKTWARVFDLNTFLKSKHGHTSTDIQHVHGVAWDPYWDRIWLSWGDNMGGNGSNGIAYSDDLGANWDTAHYWSATNAPHQVVGIQPMPKCVLFFGDLGPDVIRIDRSEGKHGGTYPTVTAWNSTAPGTHLCQGFIRADREGDDAPLLATFCAEGVAAPSFAVATLDGYTFKEIWRDTENQSPGMGARSIVGPTLRGNVIINSDDQKVGGMRSEIRAKAPGY